MNLFLYARKSTVEEERQLLSIEAQLAELREFAHKESLVIVDKFVESKTAKVPGRAVFNEMMARIERGAQVPDLLVREHAAGEIHAQHRVRAVQVLRGQLKRERPVRHPAEAAAE